MGEEGGGLATASSVWGRRGEALLQRVVCGGGGGRPWYTRRVVCGEEGGGLATASSVCGIVCFRTDPLHSSRMRF